MDEQIRQAERENDPQRLGLLNCRRGEHWWSGWDDIPRIQWNSDQIHQVLGVSPHNQGIKNRQTAAYTKRRQCFWCGKNQWHLQIKRWASTLTVRSEILAELYHEV